MLKLRMESYRTHFVAFLGAIGALIGVGLGLVGDAVVKSPSAVVYEAR